LEMNELRQRAKSSTSELALTKSPKHTSTKAEEPPLLANLDPSEKWKSWRIRMRSSISMILGFAVLMYLGQPALLLLIICVQTFMFKEIVKLGHVVSRENKLPGFRHLQWFWYVSAQYFMLTRLSRHISPWLEDSLGFVIRRNTFISFFLYAIGFVGFVFSLKKGHYRYQFTMFAWCHLTLVIVVIQSSFTMYNMFQGLIWFVLPASLIIVNDMSAYFFGFFWGKTPLIKLSPKKTWEGFIGATVTTLVFGFFLPRFFSQFDFMICPKSDFSLQPLSCEREYAFIPVPYDFPRWVALACQAVGCHWTHFSIAPIQFHGMVLSLFASIIAPFGGFFASGFKRAFKIKDFGETIPGHGGVTDRMDCQLMMGVFVYAYHTTFIASTSDASSVLYFFSRMSSIDQLESFNSLQSILLQKGLLSAPAQFVTPTPG